MRLPCRNRSDTSNLKIYFDFAFVLNSLFLRRHKFYLTTSSALIAIYLMKPARNSKNIYIYILHRSVKHRSVGVAGNVGPYKLIGLPGHPNRT